MDWKNVPKGDGICSFFDLAGTPPNLTPVHCEKQATWVHQSRCGCGEQELTMRYCDEHYNQHEEREHQPKVEIERIEGLPPGIVGYRRKR